VSAIIILYMSEICPRKVSCRFHHFCENS
jgi:hypothetical protein